MTDSGDPTYSFTYDEKWRMVATYREADSNPKEQFYTHGAGVAGRGGSSYIDSVILRDRDIYQSSMLTCAVDGWPLAADDSLDERRYYAQNWRSDVAAVLTESGRQVEQIRYGAYGLPWGLPAGDLNADGDADAGDLSAANTLIGASQYDVRADINLDGVLNTSDTAIYPSTTLGRGVISDNGTLNRKGYAGYELTGGSIADIWHVRHRVMHTGLGRWIQRNDEGYSVSSNLLSNNLRIASPGSPWRSIKYRWVCAAECGENRDSAKALCFETMRQQLRDAGCGADVFGPNCAPFRIQREQCDATADAVYDSCFNGCWGINEQSFPPELASIFAWQTDALIVADVGRIE